MTAVVATLEEKIAAFLEYRFETGYLIWAHRPREMFKTYRAFRVWNARFSGKQAGSKMPAGYLLVSIEKKRMYAHRIAFYLHHGRWPDGNIDHINGVRDDNRISNLREASPSQNAANMFVIKGRTPYKGVYRHKDGKYMAQLRHNYKYHYLGYHDTPEEAHAAYMKKARELFGRFANQGEMAHG